MKKISKIQISNYRAFFNEMPDKHVIILPKGENLLVYGENGSGKSSLFHALKDFFESAKEESGLNINEKRNVFSEGNNSLPEPQIKVFLSAKNTDKWEEDTQPLVFSDNSTTTNNSDLENASQAFLSYRDMLKTYFLDNEKEGSPNLFELLIENLLGKIILESSATEIETNFMDTVRQVKTLEKSYQEALNKRIIEGDIPNEDDKQEILETLSGDISETITGFSDSIKAFLEEILAEINEFLRSDKYFNAKIELKLPENYPFLRIENGELKKQLQFSIFYFDKKIENKGYHHFLNEARLSALAVCIYLVAIKKDRPTADNVKILFLDDIFIGLDMSNRLPLLEILKEEFVDYQIFMTTYDRAWFEVAKSHLVDNWKSIEMYVSNKVGFDVPVIYSENLEPLEKAKIYFDSHDYFSAGNNLRRALEKQLEKIVPITYRLESKDLQGIIDKLSQYYDDCNCGDLLTTAMREQIRNYKDIVFNPASHYDLKNPIYKAEIQKAIDLVEMLQSLPVIERKLLIGMKCNFYYRNVANDYTATYLSVENIYGVFIGTDEQRISNAKHKLVEYTPNTSGNVDTREIRLSERLIKIKNHLSLPDDEIAKDVFFNSEGKTLQQLINE